MKKVFLACLALTFYSNLLKAQGVENQTKTSANASQIYLEAGGSGFIYTINYDGRFKKIENGWGFRIGAGGFGGGGSSFFALPAQINYVLGSKGQYLELGVGVTFVAGEDISLDFQDDNKESYLFGNAVIAFRKQPFGNKGLTWRIAFTPFFGAVGEGNSGFGLLPWAGASIGFRF